MFLDDIKDRMHAIQGKYAEMSDKALYYYVMRKENWKELDAQERLKVLQEVENRHAARQGREPLTIRPLELPRGENSFKAKFDPEHPNEILIAGRFLTSKPNGFSMHTAAEILQAVIHQGFLAWEHGVCSGRIQGNGYLERRRGGETSFCGIAPEEPEAWRRCFAAYKDSEQDMIRCIMRSQMDTEVKAREYTAHEMLWIRNMYREMVGYIDEELEVPLSDGKIFEKSIDALAERLLTDEMLNEFDRQQMEKYGQTNPDAPECTMFRAFRKRKALREELLRERSDEVKKVDDILSDLESEIQFNKVVADIDRKVWKDYHRK